MTDSVLADNYKNTPYWWEGTPRPVIKDIELPKETEVAVIGSGFTGLCTAIQTSRNGLDTVVLDAQDAGWAVAQGMADKSAPASNPAFRNLPASMVKDRLVNF
jgi:heterodisulfide reductase subunit A-like polyferredoxin